MALTHFKPEPHRPATSTVQKILYVEDEDANWEITEFALRARFRLHRAANDRQAFKLLARESYDLILMDIQLSGSMLDGIQITRILKGRYMSSPPAYAANMGIFARRLEKV